MKPTLTLALVALATIGACATPNFDEPTPLPVGNSPPGRGTAQTSAPAPPPLSSGGADGLQPVPGPLPSPVSEADAGAVDAGPQSKRWMGTLAATTPALFGGGQECRYRITLQQVKVDIVAAVNGDVVAANVTAIAFEEVLSTPCSNTAIPAHQHTYALVTAALLPSGIAHLELAGLSTNHPAASLVIEGDLRAASPALSLAWHRTDYGPPLDWRVNAQITATLQ